MGHPNRDVQEAAGNSGLEPRREGSGLEIKICCHQGVGGIGNQGVNEIL